MRVLIPAAAAALQSGSVPLALLVEMDFSVPLYLTTARVDLVIAGTTYLATRGLGAVEAVRDTPAEIAPLKFTMSGVPSTSIALALDVNGEIQRGVAARIKLAILDPTTYQVVQVAPKWAGRLNTMTIEDGTPTGTLSVTAEHAGIDLLRGVPSMYTDTEQQRLYPGDLAFQFVNPQAEQRIVWPAASWGRK